MDFSTMAGIARAKAQGVKIPACFKMLDWELYQQVTKEGSIDDIAARLGVSKPMLYNHLKRRLMETES
jgi:hypothetical protein